MEQIAGFELHRHAPADIWTSSMSRGYTLLPSTSVTVIEWPSTEKTKLGSQEMETRRKR